VLTAPARRRSGLLVPLFSMPSSRSWGIGEIGDIATMAAWMAGAGQRVLQLLPINEMPSHETSPYSALSAMAVDPQFITLADLEDCAALGGERALDADLQARLGEARTAVAVDYTAVRALKEVVLRRCFGRFLEIEWNAQTRRADSLRDYLEDQAWWLDEYALFRALRTRYRQRPWTEWSQPIRDHEPAALATARRELAEDILYRQYLQWVAGDQWAAARRACGGVALFGDLPYMVSGDSADVWARQGEFRLDMSVGVPPDAFSETGQDWGFPAYRWDVVASGDYRWLCDRARRNADLFDGYRVDHVVGFYRTYSRPLDGRAGRFTPEDQASQLEQGEQVLAALRGPGTEIIAEDLGSVPDFVRESLVRQGIPGYKVLRWERAWHREGQPFLDPAEYPAESVATSGTHDTEPMAVWWAGASEEQREAVLAIPSLQSRLSSEDRLRGRRDPGLTTPVRDAVIETLYASGSELLILPVQDVFGWTGRINQPATTEASNWTWRLPWLVDRWSEEPEATAAAARLQNWSRKYAR
jgi:4-alpha-glucanotransferase